MKKSFVISTITVSLLFGASLLQASAAPATKSSKASIEKEVHTQQKMVKSTPKEIVIGFQDTFKAVQALQKKDTAAATKELREAKEMFDKALKANPALKLLPVASQMQIAEIDANKNEIKDALKLAKKALEKHHLDEARAILANMQDVLVVNTQYLPTDAYPLSTKNALQALDKGKDKEALDILMTGFSTIVADTVVMPIPLLTAQDLITTASKVDKSDKKRALALLDSAKSELKKAELLGYTDKNTAEYKKLTEQIDTIKKEINGKNVVVKLYDKLKDDFEALIHKTRNKSYQDSAATQKAKALLRPSAAKGEAATRTKVAKTNKNDLLKAKEKAQSFAKKSVQSEKK